MKETQKKPHSWFWKWFLNNQQKAGITTGFFFNNEQIIIDSFGVL